MPGPLPSDRQLLSGSGARNRLCAAPSPPNTIAVLVSCRAILFADKSGLRLQAPFRQLPSTDTRRITASVPVGEQLLNSRRKLPVMQF